MKIQQNTWRELRPLIVKTWKLILSDLYFVPFDLPWHSIVHTRTIYPIMTQYSPFPRQLRLNIGMFFLFAFIIFLRMRNTTESRECEYSLGRKENVTENVVKDTFLLFLIYRFDTVVWMYRVTYMSVGKLGQLYTFWLDSRREQCEHLCMVPAFCFDLLDDVQIFMLRML